MMSLKKRWLLLVVSLLSLLHVPAVFAHDPELSAFKFIHTADGELVVSVTTHISKLQIEPTTDDAEQAIRDRIAIRINGRPFQPGKSHIIRDEANDVVIWQAQYSGTVERIEVLRPLFPEEDSARSTVAILRDGRLQQEAVLDRSTPRFDSARPQAGTEQSASQVAIALNYFQQGIAHTWGGIDHVLFVLGLILLGGTLRSLFWTVSAFTIAHSITLSIAVLDLWSPSSHVVEPIIALSIVTVAAENLFQAKRTHEKYNSQWRPLIAFAFGLIHGFGFAGALMELGLPRESMALALATFNIGVEVGQAAIVAIVAPLLAWLMAKSRVLHQRIVLAGSLTIALAGAFWFAERISS